MITLGVDPGTATMGFGVVHGDGDPKLLEHGVVKTRSTEPMPERLLQLFNGLNQVIVDHAPDVMAVEQLFFARNVTNALAVGQARGVVLLAGAQHGIPVFEYKPSEVKLAVAGHGAADKQQVQSMVQLILSLDAIPHPDDAADALAVAICHVYSSRLGRIASRQ
ncbi:MAG: crossover junction endodeoxyribonuclease RuvC [Chloroflexia bacterium]|nr:crossover junction endodeoxyribonuclease RuvC [Chloroflexia bacterium]